jgi:FlaA1/EpsC-like NDP-sugar epimerase
MAKGGEIFVLDMGGPVKIADLAKDLIRLSGFEPGVDIKVEYTGLRLGEKLYEELLLNEEGIQATKQEGIFIAEPQEFNFNEVQMWIKSLENSMNNSEELKECLARIVPTYSYHVAKEQGAANGKDNKVLVGRVPAAL